MASLALRNRTWLHKSGDWVLTAATGLATLLVLCIVGVILGDIGLHGWQRISWAFISSAPTEGMTEGGIFPAIYGTCALVILMALAVVPLGVVTALYLHEYADPRALTTRLVRIAVYNLAGVPSIVFGLFGLGFFVQFVGAGIDKVIYAGEKVYGQPALIWAALTLAALTLPVVIVATEEALRAVPQELRQASAALGATRLQTVLYMVLPQSLAGVLTGTILAVSRGAGEVAPILFTGAAYFLPHLPTSPHDQFMELGYHVYILATQSPDVDATKPMLYSTVLVLLALTFLLNGAAVVIRARLRRRSLGGRS